MFIWSVPHSYFDCQISYQSFEVWMLILTFMLWVMCECISMWMDWITVWLSWDIIEGMNVWREHNTVLCKWATAEMKSSSRHQQLLLHTMPLTFTRAFKRQISQMCMKFPDIVLTCIHSTQSSITQFFSLVFVSSLSHTTHAHTWQQNSIQSLSVSSSQCGLLDRLSQWDHRSAFSVFIRFLSGTTIKLRSKSGQFLYLIY